MSSIKCLSKPFEIELCSDLSKIEIKYTDTSSRTTSILYEITCNPPLLPLLLTPIRILNVFWQVEYLIQDLIQLLSLVVQVRLLAICTF